MGIARIIAENEQLRQELATQKALLAERDAQIAALKISNEDLAQRLELLRIKASERRNQRYIEDPAAIPLPLTFTPTPPPPRLPESEPTPEPTPEPAPTADAEKPKAKEKKRSQRRDLSQPSQRPVRKLACKVDPKAACKKCGGILKVFGTSHAYRVEWVPGHFETLDIERERCACPNCPSEGVLVAPPPDFALPKAMCGNGLLAKVLVDKFADRIPLNLQVERMRREGEVFSVATLCDWILLAAGEKLLGRIAKAIGDRLMAGSWVQVDDTGYPVQDGLDGKLRKGRLWAITDQQEVWYQFTDTKEGIHPADFLENFKGKLLLVDGGSEFNLVVDKKELLRAGCWSHLRSYFFDARHHYPNEARLALGTLRDLFSIEAGLVGASHETILDVRQRDSRPLVEGFFNWVVGIRREARPTSLLGAALTYAVNGRENFERFLAHPELPMHNNRAELALRGPVCGRKAWLFAGSEGGAKAGATLFTLLNSCKMQGIDPWVYLADVLSRIQHHPVNQIHLLTPLHWRLAREG